MQELRTQPLKEFLPNVLSKFDKAWFEDFIKKQSLPNIPAYLKVLPKDIKGIVESRLKEDYQKYRDQFTYGKFILVLREYRPDLSELSYTPLGERWFKGLWILLERYFQSLK